MQGQGISPYTADTEVNEENKAHMKQVTVTPFELDKSVQSAEEWSEFIEDVSIIHNIYAKKFKTNESISDALITVLPLF